MALRIIQAGSGPRRVVVIAYFIADNHALLRSLSKEACVLADLDNPSGRFAKPVGAGGVDTLSRALAYAQAGKGPWEVAAVVLVGWSAGCQAVREQLRVGARPDVVIALDGISGFVPPNNAQLAPWRDLVGRARSGQCLAVVTCTQNLYTRDLPPGERYEATAYTAAELWSGRRPRGIGDLLLIGARREGGLLVEAHASGRCDGAAHRREQTEHLPRLLADVVGPWLSARGLLGAPTEAAPSTLDPVVSPLPATVRDLPQRLSRGAVGETVRELQSDLARAGYAPGVADGIFGAKTEAAVRALQGDAGLPQSGAVDPATRAALVARLEAVERPTLPSGGTWAEAILTFARSDLASGIRETARNDGGEIRRLYLDPMGLPPGSNWCAAAVTSWIRRAAASMGREPPIRGSAGARAIGEQLAKIGKWRARTQLRPEDVLPGRIAIWDRSVAGRPETAWQGHIGVVAGPVIDGVFATIEGNSGPTGDRVAAMSRRLDDPKIIGIGWLD